MQGQQTNKKTLKKMEHSCQIEKRIKKKTNATTERTNAKNRQNRSGEAGAGKLCEQQTERLFPSSERESIPFND